MTRWQRLGWALGYTLLTVCGVFVWLMANETGLFDYFGAASLIYGLSLGAFANNGIIATLSTYIFFLLLGGLVVVPILTAFRLRVPLYILMGLDVLGRVLLIVDKLLIGDTYMLAHIVIGLLISIGLLAATIHIFLKPEPEKEV